MPNMRALIIDDEPDIRELLEITLSRMALDVDSAANIREAKTTWILVATTYALPI
jgi:Two-component response regulator PilR